MDSNIWFSNNKFLAGKSPIRKSSSIVNFVPTLGQCGMAIQQGDHWIFYICDAYYYRVELERYDHPVSQLATVRADYSLFLCPFSDLELACFVNILVQRLMFCQLLNCDEFRSIKN